MSEMKCRCEYPDYLGPCEYPNCEPLPAPTQNPHTEEGEKRPTMGDVLDLLHGEECAQPSPPEDNTSVAIPEEKMRPHGEITSVLLSTPVSEAFKIADWVDKEIDFQLSAANTRIEELIASAEAWEGKYHQAEKEIADMKDNIAELIRSAR